MNLCICYFDYCNIPVRGVKTGQPGPFWPGPFLACIKRAGPGWPDMVKRVVFLSPARRLAGWQAGGPTRQFFLICIICGPIRF